MALSTLAVGLDAVLGNSHPLARGDAGALAFAAVASEGVPPMRDQLALHLARNPRDGRGWMLLARIEFDRDRFHAAADAFRNAIDASPKVARDPGVWCEYADALAMAQGGILAGRPRELIERALTLDAGHARALEMAGSAAFEAGDFAAAARNWRQLLAQMPEATQERRDLRARHPQGRTARQRLRSDTRHDPALASRHGRNGGGERCGGGQRASAGREISRACAESR